MAGATTTYGLPYPELVDPPDGPAAVQALAEATEAELERVDAGVPWQDYTPTMLGGWTVGAGSIEGRYQRVGNTVHFRILAVLGAGFSAPAAGITFTLPTDVQEITTATNGKYQMLAQGVFTDVGLQNYGTLALPGGDTVSLYVNGTSGGAVVPSAVAPFTWVNGDFIEVVGTYEAVPA